MGIMTQAMVKKSGWNESLVLCDIHTGTHLDAPYHFLDEGMTIDKIPLETFMGSTVIADLQTKGPNEVISPGDLQKYDEPIRKYRKLLLNTGWSRYFGKEGKPDYYTEFPQLSLETAQWLADRRLLLLGVDFPAPSNTWNDDVHRLLFRNGTLVIIENLTNLAELRKEVVNLIALPLKYLGREGSQIRAIAIED
jgi:arylformamidase